jgi:hypothetical protein
MRFKLRPRLRKIIQNLILFILPISVLGQSDKAALGIGYGFGFSDISNHTHLKNRYEMKSSSSIIFDFKYKLNSRSAIVIGIGIEEKGGKFQSIEREFTTIGNTIILGDTIMRLNKNEFAYLTFPISYNHKIATLKNFDFFIAVGGYYSQLIKQQWNWELLDVFALTEVESLEFNHKNWDAGFLTNLGITMPIGKIIEIETSFNFTKGLVNFIDNSENNKAKHQRIYGQVKVYFELNRNLNKKR